MLSFSYRQLFKASLSFNVSTKERNFFKSEENYTQRNFFVRRLLAICEMRFAVVLKLMRLKCKDAFKRNSCSLHSLHANAKWRRWRGVSNEAAATSGPLEPTNSGIFYATDKILWPSLQHVFFSQKNVCFEYIFTFLCYYYSIICFFNKY